MKKKRKKGLEVKCVTQKKESSISPMIKGREKWEEFMKNRPWCSAFSGCAPIV